MSFRESLYIFYLIMQLLEMFWKKKMTVNVTTSANYSLHAGYAMA
jgi:hypothetical protein